MIELFKAAVFRFAPARTKHRLRRSYLRRSVMHGAFPEREGRVVRWLVTPGDVTIDIGANVGFYTRLLAQRVGRSGKVFAFEPIPQNFEILESVVAKGTLRNVEAFRAALDSEAGSRWMIVPEAEGFQGFYKAHFADRDTTPGQRYQVRRMRLDDWYPTTGQTRLDFIKCDVEGEEPGVIAGGSNTIRRHRPGILMEVARTTSDEIFGFFHKLGYRAFVYGRSLRPVGGYLDRQFSNYFFLHPESRIGRHGQALAARTGHK